MAFRRAESYSKLLFVEMGCSTFLKKVLWNQLVFCSGGGFFELEKLDFSGFRFDGVLIRVYQHNIIFEPEYWIVFFQHPKNKIVPNTNRIFLKKNFDCVKRVDIDEISKRHRF